MILRKGNLWESGADLICVTGNAFIRSDGAVVMGRGAALECKRRFNGIDLKFGKLIRAFKNEPYGLVITQVEARHPTDMGLFQVKHHFRDAADLGLIENSVKCLNKAIRDFEFGSVSINFPGIGYGRRDRAEVLSLIQSLPDNVEVWEYAD